VGRWFLYFIPLPTLKRVEDVIQGRRKEHEIGSVKSSTLTVEINMRKKTELCEKLHTHHGLLSTGRSGQIAARDTVL
jgi:nitrogenase molybdenum-iron protein alpha/beta subunit